MQIDGKYGIIIGMSLLSPLSIAIIGASATPGKVGHDIVKNLLTQGYKGAVYPVNPKGGEILGKRAFATVKDIPKSVDLAIIVIPAAAVPDALRECGEKKIPSAVVISAGFSETHTEEGKSLEEELKQIAKQYDIELIGPNCLGIVRPSIHMNASFAKELPPAGGVALISQSGATAVALMDSASTLGIAFSSIISIGNKAVLDESDMLELCAKDEETKVIGFYLESIRDGRRFLETAARVVQTKPIVLLKAGTSEQGKKAASSHTGALAGSDAAVDALCKQTGIHRAHSYEEFCDLLSVLSTQPPLLSPRIAIITNAGGPGILATDATAPLQLPALSSSIESKLREQLPPSASTANPIDLIGDAGVDRYRAALIACREDKNIDGVVVLLTPQVMTPCEEIAENIVDVMKENTLMPVVTCFMGGESVREGKNILRKNGVPVFETPERAVRALQALHLFFCQGDKRTKNAPSPIRTQPALSFLADVSKASTSASSLPSAKQGFPITPRGDGPLLDEQHVSKLFADYNLPLPAQALAKSVEEAVKIAEAIGYPVIAKISSPQILHKTDIGGVRANLKSKKEIHQAYNDIIDNVQNFAKTSNEQRVTINGVLVQQFLPVGNEFIVGGLRDQSFGPLVMVGLGGIYTELFRDVSFRIAPINVEDAYAMLQELNAWKLLLGMRGKPQADIDALAQTIVKIAQMMHECTEILELDLNPVLVGSFGIVIADAKVIV